MLRIAICDDQPSERELLGRFLRAYFAAHPYEYELTEYAGGEPLVDDYEDGCACFDLIFLDIFLDGILGMEAARSLRRFAPRVPIIFLTASPDYALESYDVRAYGYLVKPLDAGRAGALLERVDHFALPRFARLAPVTLVSSGLVLLAFQALRQML